MEHKVYLMPGDLVFFESEGKIGTAIRWIETKRGKDRRSYVNHVAPVISPGWLMDALIADAQPPRVRVSAVGKYAGDLVAIYRAIDMLPSEREKVALRAEQYVGKFYGFGKILLHLLGLEGWSLIDWFPICSWVSAVPYAQVMKWEFGTNARVATPDTQWDYVRAHPEKWQCIKPLGILE